MKMSGLKKKLSAGILIFALLLSTVTAGAAKPIRAKADGNPVVEMLVEQAIERAFSLACYGFSYGMHAIDDAVDDEAYSQVVSFFDAFVWDTEVTWALEELEEMCEEILKSVERIEERQTEYGQAVLGKIDNAEIQSARRILDERIDADINDKMIYNGIDTTEVIKAYTAYLAADKPGASESSYAAEKDKFDKELDNLYGNAAITDKMRYVDGRIGAHLHNVLRNLTTAMCAEKGSAQYLSDETVMDAAAQLAYLYYPWSQDQYSFVQFEFESQVQQIIMVELVYQEYLARQYNYLKENGYLDDTSSIGAQCYEKNKANLISDNADLAERFYNYTEKSLYVSPTVSLKLYQYYKPLDTADSVYWADNKNGNIVEYTGSQVHGALLLNNSRERINYHTEEKDFLYDDYHGGPLQGIDDNNFESVSKAGIVNCLSVNLYPVVRSGGVDIYCIDNNRIDLWNDGKQTFNNEHRIGDLVVANGAGWGYGEQGFPSITFFNRYHGQPTMVSSNYFLKSNKSTEGSSDAKDEYASTTHTNYRMARSAGELKPLVSSNTYSVFYNGHLASYLGLNGSSYDGLDNDTKPDYLLFGNYSVSDNTAFGGTGKVSLHTIKTDGVYDYATIDTHETILNSHDILHKGTESDGTPTRDKYYAAVYVPENPGTNMKTSVSFANVVPGGFTPNMRIEGGKDLTVGSTPKKEFTSGEMIKIKVRPDNKYVPDSIKLYPTALYRSGDVSGYQVVEEKALTSMSPDEDGYYTIELPAPYFSDATYEILYSLRHTSVVDVTKPLNNENGAYMKHSVDELRQLLLTAEEDKAAEEGADVRFELKGTGISELTDEMKEKFKEAAEKTGYNIFERYVNFDIEKRINFRDAVKIDILPGGEITIAMQLPESLRPKNNVDREFKILREHDGKTDLIETKYDKETNELTFETDRFSTYALIYRDIRKSPKTGER